MTFKAGVNVLEPHIVEGYEVLFADGVTEWHFTSGPQDFTFLTNDYEPVPIGRKGEGGQEAVVKVGKETVVLKLSQAVRDIIDFDKIRHRRALDRAEVKIYQIDMNNLANYRLRYNGFVGVVRCNERRLIIDTKDVFFLFKKNVPVDMYGESCNLIFGSPTCTFDLATEKVSGTADAGSDEDTLVDAARVEADGFFDRGYVTMTSGSLTGERARVRFYTVGSFKLMPPFLDAIANGDGYDAQPSCQKTFAGCLTRANTDNHFAFQYIPRPEQVQV